MTAGGDMWYQCWGNLNFPEATFESLRSMGNMFFSNYSLYAPKAVFGKVTSTNSASISISGQILLESATFESLTSFNSLFNSCTKELVLHSINMGKATTATSFCPKAKLDKQSLLQIASTIKEYTDGTSHKIDLGIDATLTGDAEVLSALDAIAAKGWTVTHKFN